MTHTEIISGLQQYWSLNGPQNVPTIFPGASTSVASETLWVEFWVSQLTEQIKRPSGPLSQQLTIDVHVFSNSQNKRDVNVLADEVVATLRSAIVPIPSVPSPGTLRIEEPVVRDLTRSETTGNAIAVQHWLVTVPAFAIADSL